MFAYCNNNPINYSDTLGCRPSKGFYPICIGGSYAPPKFVGTSDSEKDSDMLLQHILDNNSTSDYPFEGNTVYISVEYAGVYKNYPNIPLDIALFLAGTYITTLSNPFAVAVGGLLTVYSGVDMFYSWIDPLPNREYDQYTVTMCWTTTVSPVGFPDVSIYSEHCVRISYIWNDTYDDSSYWHIYSYDYSSTNRSRFS